MPRKSIKRKSRKPGRPKGSKNKRRSSTRSSKKRRSYKKSKGKRSCVYIGGRSKTVSRSPKYCGKRKNYVEMISPKGNMACVMKSKQYEKYSAGWRYVCQ
jgi:hypothetical protein